MAKIMFNKIKLSQLKQSKIRMEYDTVLEHNQIVFLILVEGFTSVTPERRVYDRVR